MTKLVAIVLGIALTFNAMADEVHQLKPGRHAQHYNLPPVKPIDTSKLKLSHHRHKKVVHHKLVAQH